VWWWKGRTTKLERWAQEWARSGRHDAYLLRDERLRAALQWTAAHGDLAGGLPLVGKFLDRSRHHDRAARERLSEAVAQSGRSGGQIAAFRV
jgi:hypothetical protein